MALPAPVGAQQLDRIFELFQGAEEDLNRRLMQVLGRGDEWFREARRLRDLRDAARVRMAEIRAALSEDALAEGLGELYAQGATRSAGVLGNVFSWAQPHLGAVNLMAADMHDDLLTATRYVEDAVKQTIRQAAQLASGRKLLEGRTAIQAGNLLARELRATGIGVVTYRNGARHGVGEYARMVQRTKSAVAYSVGTVNHSAASGVQWMECSDGSSCGFTSHDDTVTASGLIVSVETAAAWPIAHPNCVRSYSPRPDLNGQPIDDAASRDSSTTLEAQADQQAFEKFMREQQKAKAARGRAARAKREPRQPRVPRRPTATGPAPAPVPPPAAPAAAPVPAAPAAAVPVAPTAPSAAGGPGTQPVALSDSTRYLDRRAQHFEPYMRAVDELHGVPAQYPKPMDGLTVTYGPQRGNTAGFFSPRSAIGKPEIAVRHGRGEPLGGGGQTNSFLHEVGHRTDFIDYDLAKKKIYYASELQNPNASVAEVKAVTAWLDAVKASPAYRRVIDAARPHGQIKYFTSQRELWARSYSQWAAGEMQGPIGQAARAGLEHTRRTNIAGSQWSDDEFKAIGPLVRDVLKARGLLR